MKPLVPINVDEVTGEWKTNDLPMLYVPRHFFINNHKAIETELGLKRYSKILYSAGYKSAYYWCGAEAKTHQLNGINVFHHYLKSLSQRGWGLFSFIDDNLDSLKIMVAHSAFVKYEKQFNANVDVGHKVCYMFGGWFAGAADWVAQDLALSAGFVGFEESCVCSANSEYCVFIIKRKI